jgi:hypothetical protein
MRNRIPTSTPAERRVQREIRSAELRARALALRQAGKSYAAIGRALDVSPARAAQMVGKAERLRDDPHWWDDLPARAQYFLYDHDLTSASELDAAHAVAQRSRRELMRRPNFGNDACTAIIAWLARHGLKLRPESATAFSRRMIQKHLNDNGRPHDRAPVFDSDDPWQRDAIYRWHGYGPTSRK